MSPHFACAAGLAGLAMVAAGCDSDDSLDLRPYTIDTRDDGQPTGALVAHETATGWVAAAETTPGVFTFTPTGEDVVYAVICPPDADTDFRVDVAYESLSGPDDDRSYAQSCYRYVPETVERQVVVFDVIPAEASLGIAGHFTYGGGDGTFALRLKPGARDLVAMTADRVLIQRAATFDPASTFVVDVTTEGVERTPLALTLPSGAADEVVGASYRFRTAGGATGVDFTPRPEIRVVPASLVQGGDAHSVEVSAEREGSRRWLVTTNADPAKLDLSGGFAPTFANVDATWNDQFVMTWTGRPADAAWISAWIFQGVENSVSWSADFHVSWLERHDQASDGTWTPPDLSALAGWSSAWNLDRARRESSSWTLGYFDSIDVDGGDLAFGRGSDWSGDFFEDPSLRAPTPARRTASRAAAR